MVLCTYNQAAALKEIDLAFNLIVLDEASQVAETLALVPLMCCAAGSQLVLAGDHKQMKPHTKLDADNDKVRSMSMMERLCEETRTGSTEKKTVEVVELRTQYRMPAGVCGVVSNVYYEGALETAISGTK